MDDEKTFSKLSKIEICIKPNDTTQQQHSLIFIKLDWVWGKILYDRIMIKKTTNLIK